MARITQAEKIAKLEAMVEALLLAQAGDATPAPDAPATRKASGKASPKLNRWNEGMFSRYGIVPEVGFTFNSRSGNAFEVVKVGTDAKGAYVLTRKA